MREYAKIEHKCCVGNEKKDELNGLVVCRMR